MSKITKTICINCSCPFIPKRNPAQKYCGQQACQNARKRKWRTQKLNNDPDYRENRNAACRKWRKINSTYWQQYRAKRKCNNSTDPPLHTNTSLFANSDALNSKLPIKTGIYRLTPEGQEFANSDALIVNIAFISSGYNGANIPPYSQ